MIAYCNFLVAYPILLVMYLGMQTENIRLGHLGLVLPCHNPIRVAEDIAILDQVTKGRAFAGFARGYQPRWVNTLGQHYDTLADNNTDPERYEMELETLLVDLALKSREIRQLEEARGEAPQ